MLSRVWGNKTGFIHTLMLMNFPVQSPDSMLTQCLLPEMYSGEMLIIMITNTATMMGDTA